MRAQNLMLFALLAACGGDDEAPPPNKPNQPATAAAAPGKIDDKNKLKPRAHVEDRIQCPVPDKPTGPACEQVTEPSGSGAPPPSTGKMLADCEPGLYCLRVADAFSCEPCSERDTIRHEFKDRDFVSEQARDPFQSFVILVPGVGQQGGGAAKPEPHQSCKRPDQFVATNYSFQDLRLVGIVAQGTQRKVLMMDTGNLGHIVKRGDCVGKEKAVVKDIGTGYVTFVVEEDSDLKRPATETSVQLHPNSLDVEPTAPPSASTGTTTAPIVTPSGPQKSSSPPPEGVPVITPNTPTK